MRLELTDRCYIRDIKVSLELKIKNHRLSFGSFGSLRQDICDKYPPLNEIKKFRNEIKCNMRSYCENICTTKDVYFDDKWFLRWDKDCYNLCYFKSNGYKIVGHYSMYNLDHAMMSYIDKRVHKSEVKTKNEIINKFDEYYKNVMQVLKDHEWDEKPSLQRFKPKVPKIFNNRSKAKTKSSNSGMRIGTNLKKSRK